jgi:anthranilate/para-aminobenzoate synthase component I
MELKPTVREVPADLETPVSAFLKLKGHGARFLLESVEMGENLGRYSFIGLDYLRNIKVLPEHVIVEERGKSEVVPIGDRNPLEILRTLMAPLALKHDSLPGLGRRRRRVHRLRLRPLHRADSPRSSPTRSASPSATSTSPRRWSSSTT